MQTRVIVSGCREWTPKALVKKILARLVGRYKSGLVLIHGDCPTGIDRCFADLCREMSVKQETYPADWTGHGKAAGPIRNKQMIQAGGKFLIAMHRELATSKGTGGCVQLALKANIPVFWYSRDSQTDPERITKWPPIPETPLFRE